jgi:hypothetical protein
MLPPRCPSWRSEGWKIQAPLLFVQRAAAGQNGQRGQGSGEQVPAFHALD